LSRIGLALIVALCACQPFYRDNLRAGRRAADGTAYDKMISAAEQASSAGDQPRAIALARQAIHENPTRSRGFAILAINLRRANDLAGADRVIQYASSHGVSIQSDVSYAYVSDDLIADALDQESTGTLGDVASRAGATTALQELVDTGQATIDVALPHYLHWLETYGVPDHPLLRDAAASVTKRVADEIAHMTPLGKRLVAIGPNANLASAMNDVPGALALYSLAFRVLSPEQFLPYRGAMARVAAQVTTPSEIDPVAWNLAVDGNAAVEAGELGPAIHAYRRAVAHAPWWGAAHSNLADLLELARRTDEAKLERAWADGLVATTGWAVAPESPTEQTDLDADTVADPGDRCPFEPEDIDGFDDADGCPELDNDRDAVADAADTCRDVAEDKDGFEDSDGCPDLDNDRDGIPDTADACPMKPETFNGTTDTDGCPDEGRVVIAEGALVLLDPIEFDNRTAKLARRSSKILDALVATLAGNPLLVVEIGVHGDTPGKPAFDATLTQARADAVMTYLVDHHIAAVRLTAVGYGNTKPLTPGTDPKALAANRRVELTLKAR
jgi:outer membrane protein OmpA-like peptidoglycan-associated protein